MHNRNNPQIESDEDKPLFSSSAVGSKHPIFDVTTSIPTKLNHGTYNMIKGHRLLFWCIIFLLMVYGTEMWRKDGAVSPAGEKIIEILKLLIFSVSGYLFGTHNNEKTDC